jgi:hypothetical protein
MEMSHTDVLNVLLSSDPNEPAVKGELLLLRVEMKAGFRTLENRLENVEKDLGEVKEQLSLNTKSLNLVAEQVLMLVKQVSILAAKP